jgi:hypothetical protein
VSCGAGNARGGEPVPVDPVLYVPYQDKYSRLTGASWRFQEHCVAFEGSHCSFAEI